MNNKFFWIALVIMVTIFGIIMAASSNQDSTIEERPTSQSLTLTDIHGLEVDINNPDRLYLPNHQGLYVQEANGVIGKVGDISDDLMSFTLSQSDTNLYYASGHPRSGGNLGLIRSVNGGTTWEDVSKGLNGPVDFHTMTVDAKNDQHIYGYYLGALQRSLDGGNSWEYLDAAPEEQIIQLSAGAQEGRIYAATTKGLYMSSDKGASWSLFGFENETVIALEVNPTSGQLIANTSASGLVISNDNGKAWESSSFSTSDTVLYIASSPSEPTKSYLITKSLKIYQSNDSGMTWSNR